MHTPVLVMYDRLHTFAAHAFECVGAVSAEAQIAADVLLASDLRGVESHGVARLHYYLAHIQNQRISLPTRCSIVRELPTTLTIDGGNGLGMVVAHYAMEQCLVRARQYGSAAVAVRGSNHFGIAGYYAMMALEHDMIGVAMCNASPNVVPFGGAEAMLGTNPIAWAIPCGAEPAIVMDMATSGVAYGKLEIALRTGAALPLGWALGTGGQPTTDAEEAKRARRILPLGGLIEGTGYKGYALATVVEALSHALGGAAMSRDIMAVQEGTRRGSDIGHFFAAYRVDGFRELHEFKHSMDELVRTLRSCPPQPGVETVLLPGEKEHRATLQRRRDGIPLHPAVAASLQQIAIDLQIESVV